MKHLTCDIPAELYDSALDFCNARLAEDGKPLIDALPPGHPGDPYSCPCAEATCVYVGELTWTKDTKAAHAMAMEDIRKLPRHGIERFVKAFDDAGQRARNAAFWNGEQSRNGEQSSTDEPIFGLPVLPVRLP